MNYNKIFKRVLEQTKPPPEDDTENMDDVENPDEAAPVEEDPNVGAPPQDPNMQDPNAGMQDPSMGGDPSMQDPNAGMQDPNMAPEQETKDPTTIGRVYELKKIYNRLLSIEQHLSSSSDIILLKLRNYITQSIELFDTLISNISIYKEKLDDIVVLYYEFIEYIYGIMKRYYEIKADEQKNGKTKK